MQRQLSEFAALNNRGPEATLEAALVLAGDAEKLGRLQGEAGKVLHERGARSARNLAAPTLTASSAASGFATDATDSRGAYDIACTVRVRVTDPVDSAADDVDG